MSKTSVDFEELEARVLSGHYGIRPSSGPESSENTWPKGCPDPAQLRKFWTAELLQKPVEDVTEDDMRFCKPYIFMEMYGCRETFGGWLSRQESVTSVRARLINRLRKFLDRLASIGEYIWDRLASIGPT